MGVPRCSQRGDSAVGGRSASGDGGGGQRGGMRGECVMGRAGGQGEARDERGRAGVGVVRTALCCWRVWRRRWAWSWGRVFLAERSQGFGESKSVSVFSERKRKKSKRKREKKRARRKREWRRKEWFCVVR